MLCHYVFVNICYRCANICYVRTMAMCYVMFMITVRWAMNIYVMLRCYMYSRVPFYTRTTFGQKQTIQDIQPSTRPQINISQVPAGRFLFCLFRFCCFSVFLWVVLFVMFSYVFFYCKCKSLKRLGENIYLNKKRKRKEIKKHKIKETVSKIRK